MAATDKIDSTSTRTVLPEFDRRYPVIVAAEGVWLEDAGGRRYLDAMSGGSMAQTLGYGRADLVQAARQQALNLAYVHNERLTNPAQERLARELVEVSPEGFTRVRFVTGGAEANEMAMRLARAYHVERGEPDRWQIISPAQSYHGPTMATLALTGRPGLHGPFGPYMSRHAHISPSTERFDARGEAALEELDRALEAAGPERTSAFFCEAISAAALPAYRPPDHFWEGLAERRERHGFLICVDEIVTGMGRAGRWFASEGLPFEPDIIATAKGLGAGYAAIGAVLCREHVYEALAKGSRRFTLGHTWDGAPLPCAVGSAVIAALREEGLITRVAERGARLREELADALADIELAGEVRGHGFLLGVDFVDPRDRRSFLAPELGVAGRVEAAALERDLITLATQPTRDGFAGDQCLFAPPLVTGEEELSEMVRRFQAAVRAVADEVASELERGAHTGVAAGS